MGWYNRFRWATAIVLICMTIAGCGGSPSQKDVLQSILTDKGLSEQEKLEKLAIHMFDLEGFVIAPAQPSGHAVELQVRGNDDRVIRQVMQNKNSEQLHQALKEFHFKSLNLQLADYLRRAKDMHLQSVTVSLRVLDPLLSGEQAEGAERYRLILKQDNFDGFLEIAKLRVQDSLPKAEKLWQVVIDDFR